MERSKEKHAAIKSIDDLAVYRLAFEAAMEIFELSKKFPPEEKYSLTDQIRRSSRSVAINIREGFAKRFYVKVFQRHCLDSAGSSEETRGWLKFAWLCKYLDGAAYSAIDKKYDIINAMLYKMIRNWVSYDD
jgi:four helix bundle protein